MTVAFNSSYSDARVRNRATAECQTMACRLTQNVGTSERILSIVGGGIVAAQGLSRGSWKGLFMAALGGSLLYRGVTGHCHCYSALGISSNRDDESATSVPAQYGFKYEKSLIIDRSAIELYERWSDLSSLPQMMRHLESVTQTGDGRSHWIAKGPLGVRAEWDAELINNEPGRLIAWRSLPGSQVDTAGSVHFAEQPAGRGTKVTVSLKYNPPGGKIAASLAWLFGGGIEQEIAEDLRRFKQMMETGEIATTEGQPSGRKHGQSIRTRSPAEN
jgi:uncharacterized membrane protein